MLCRLNPHEKIAMKSGFEGHGVYIFFFIQAVESPRLPSCSGRSDAGSDDGEDC